MRSTEEMILENLMNTSQTLQINVMCMATSTAQLPQGIKVHLNDFKRFFNKTKNSIEEIENNLRILENKK